MSIGGDSVKKGVAGRIRGTTAVVALLAAGMVWTATAIEARAQEAAVKAVGTYDIPAQPLDTALTAFGVRSGLQVSVDGAILGGVRSRGVRGDQGPEQALSALLAGTGMIWRFIGPNTVLVERAPQGDGAMVLDAITVAGERVERSLMDTASSVAVFDAKTIENRPDLGGTNTLTESVANMVTVEPGNYAPTIRGVDGTGPAAGANAFFAGVRPRLTLQIDGRPASSNELIFGDASLWDVEQVEVFRGAQSTVQGRNSIAGAIVVKTKDPTYVGEGSARVIVGNHDTRQVSAMISGPIVENQVAIRLAADRWTSQSELPFLGYTGEDDPGSYESTNLRAKLLIEPKKIDGLRVLFTLNHTDFKGPQGEYVYAPFENGVPQNAYVATFNPRSTAGILEASWEIDENLTLENVFSLTDIQAIRHSTPGTGNLTINGREGVLEPRVRFSAFDHRLKGFGGYYGLRAHQHEHIDLFGGNDFADKTATDALFGEATLSLTDDVDLTAGARYEREDRRRFGGSGNYVIEFDETYNTFLPKLGLAWRPDDQWTLGAVVSRGYNGGGAGLTWAAPFVNYSYEPEYVWNYEAYARAELMGGRLRMTGNVFYADYEDLQLPYQLAANSTIISNAKRAAVYGTEIGARWLATPELELFGDIGLLKTEILDYPGSSYEGNELPHAPALTASFGANYRPFEGVEIGIDARYSDAYYSEVTNSARGKTDPYWVANAHAGYDFGTAKVFAYARNLFDTETPLDIGLGRTVSTDYATMLRPLTVGMGVQMNF